MNINVLYSSNEIRNAWITGHAFASKLVQSYAIVDESPEDLVQTVFMKLYEGSRKLPTNLPLDVIVINVIKSHASNAVSKQISRFNYMETYQHEPSACHNNLAQTIDPAGYSEISYKETLASLVSFLESKREFKCIEYIMAINSEEVSPSSNIESARKLDITVSEFANLKKKFKRLVSTWWKIEIQWNVV